ncbi:heavy metal-binding domain-containing protein [Xanthomonas melonis]|nr:heavy metal-binding domain-containing protein [Xanthomonas melonis]
MNNPYNSSPVPGVMQHLNDTMVTTALELPGYRIVRSLGLVRGITVRSRSIVGNFFGGLQTLLGGNITIYWCDPVISRADGRYQASQGSQREGSAQ